MMPQPRGQITLPVKFREKYGIKPGVQVKVSDQGERITIEPLEDPLVSGPKYSKQEVKRRLKKYEESGKVYWTKANDKRLASLRKKDNKYLNW